MGSGTKRIVNFERRPPIKIAHVSSCTKGGATIAAFRIHQALLKHGVDSHFLCIDGSLQGNNISEFNLPDSPGFKKIADKIKWRFKHHFGIELTQKDLLGSKLKALKPSLECEIASLPFSDCNFLKDPIVETADIIHLHWVAGLLDYPSFFKFNKKPVIWTLHDMNPFTGIFHFEEDEEKNSQFSKSLSTRVAFIKKQAIQKRRAKLEIVGPSNWLLDKAKNSDAFKDLKGTCIPYPLDSSLFQQYDKKNLKNKLRIPVEDSIFLFVAQKVDNYRKGFDLLIESFKLINKRGLTVLVVGDSEKIRIADLNILYLGTINDEKILSEYYSVADAFILPSREDNLPNVMIESLVCGTPIICFNVGGMSDIIVDGFNGLKVKKIEVMALVKALNEFLETKESYNPHLIRQDALKKFSVKDVAGQYRNVYNSLLDINA